jgi:hypothetical protein
MKIKMMGRVLLVAIVAAVGYFCLQPAVHAVGCAQCSEMCADEANQCSLNCPPGPSACLRECIREMRNCEIQCFGSCD